MPVVEALERDLDATALYVFPTKALAQDQKRALGELVAGVEGLERVTVATFDGDTPRDDRDFIREYANVVSSPAVFCFVFGVVPFPESHSSRIATYGQIFTNPDMLHLTILPQEERWRRFFRNLKFVVVDELHIYAGLFGCHVAFVMRRQVSTDLISLSLSVFEVRASDEKRSSKPCSVSPSFDVTG